MFGVGATEMAGVLATGEIWLAVPETIEIEWAGRLAPGVVAKDIMLFLCAKLGMEGGRTQAVHFRGEAIRALGMQERMTLANMTAELGGQTGWLIPTRQRLNSFARQAPSCASQVAVRRRRQAAEQHRRYRPWCRRLRLAQPANAAAVRITSRCRLRCPIGACTGPRSPICAWRRC
jgi:3-isopropylmalate/(R)-2-methylmalate dehydratase large subunit